PPSTRAQQRRRRRHRGEDERGAAAPRSDGCAARESPARDRSRSHARAAREVRSGGVPLGHAASSQARDAVVAERGPPRRRPTPRPLAPPEAPGYRSRTQEVPMSTIDRRRFITAAAATALLAAVPRLVHALQMSVKPGEDDVLAVIDVQNCFLPG